MVSLAFHTTSSSSGARVLRPRLSTMRRLASAFEAVVAEWQVRRAIKSVEAMESRLLLDIGITRGGIEDAVRHGR